MELKKIKPLISSRLGWKKKITNIETSVPEFQDYGFGSVLLKLKVTVQGINGEEELLYLVAKRLPATENFREMFNIQETFKKEIQFYEVILPTLERFQKEENITDVLEKHFAKFYGARYNFEGSSDIIDDDGVLLMEDLSVRGFGNVDFKIGFNLETAESILHDLAKFHGTAMALKYKKPDVFEEHIKPLCIPFILKDNLYASVLKLLKQLIESFPEYATLSDKATNVIGKEHPPAREPYGTIIHFDFYVNNIMNRTEDGEKVKNILVDFQFYGYRSAAADVFFFLWTSVQREVLENKMDHLLNYYHQSLLDRLKAFGLDISIFSYEKFEEDIRLEAEYEFGHTLLIMFFLKFYRESKFSKNYKFTVQLDDLTPELKNYVHFMVTESVKRRWL